tara:strand:- start:1752 stop:2543 length:792 start_codon:yes stop_codon:yes gene_type:complete
MLKNKYPIYILSKGRASNCVSANNLYADNYDNFKIVVEPQDYNAYKFYFDEINLLQMDKNDMGIAYVRNFIKNNAKGFKYHWALDDDLRFKKRYYGKNRTYNNDGTPVSPVEMFCEIEDYVDKYSNIAIAGLRNSAFAFSFDGKDKISFNKQIASCALIKTNIPAKYENNIIEDTDFSMQVLNKNYCTVIFNKLLFDNPPQGKVAGGNTGDIYHNKITKLQQALSDKWKCFDIQLLEGKSIPSRIKPSRIWGTFKQRPIPYES